ncbi:hydrolase, alpha/beta fold family, putative [Coleofasciculus chthonoplastes PCC 7420]|uniref:Hydrolase, alpha/beta fold family, putative n=1 Tax=Coleofasciculus chthonoplastes PCC 7420 TaxID=118168 RepID=B4VLC7_9CYAN|nr:hydrolase, alpha/beta fold family, putative [Coleofasciculus chthonoplastes PCC 7420]
MLAYDLAGHGESTPYQRYSLGRHRRDLNRLLKHLHIKSPLLCCHSYGVPLGLEWARKHPVQGLVLIAGGTHDLAPWWEIPLMKFFAWGGRYLYYLPGVQSLTNHLSSDHTGKKIERFFAESPVPTEPHPYKALEIFWDYNFFTRNRSSVKFQFPVLVISGGKDPMFTKTMGVELAAVFPLGQHLHLPEAGHLLIGEYPDLVNRVIADLL